MTHLNHPHIVGLLDVLQCTEPLALARSEPNFLCIVMDYVEDAEKLSTLILRNGSDPAQAKKVVSQVGSALAHVHERNLIHRDLWSENVLVNRKTGHVTLIDFGCAEYICSDAPPEDHVNRPYASPEMTRREKPNAGDDCWALGLVITGGSCESALRIARDDKTGKTKCWRRLLGTWARDHRGRDGPRGGLQDGKVRPAHLYDAQHVDRGDQRSQVSRRTDDWWGLRNASRRECLSAGHDE